MWNAVTRQFHKTNTYIHNLDEKCHFTLHFWLFANCKVFVCQLLDSKICPQTMHKLHITYLIKFNFGLKHRRDPAICSYLRFSLWYFHASIRRILWQTYGPKYGWVERAICGIHLSTNLSISVDLTLCLSIQLKCNSIPSEGILSTIRVFDFKCFKVLIRFTFALQPKTLVTNDFNLWIMMEAQATHFQCSYNQISLWMHLMIKSILSALTARTCNKWLFDCEIFKKFLTPLNTQRANYISITLLILSKHFLSLVRSHPFSSGIQVSELFTKRW